MRSFAKVGLCAPGRRPLAALLAAGAVAAGVAAAGCGPRQDTAAAADVRPGGPASTATGPSSRVAGAAGGGEARLTPDEVRSAHISVTTVGYQELDRELAASGKIAFDDQRVTHVFSPVTGRVLRLLAQPGQKLRRGDPLALIVSPDVGSALADAAKAQAALGAASRELTRQRELYAVRATAQRDLEAAESNERQARAELERAREKARLLGGGGDRVTQSFVLRSPIAGEVIARATNPGVEVQGQYAGGTAVELFTIGELDRVWALADVFEADLGRVAVGATVSIEVVTFPGRKFPGRVDWISGAIDPATRTAKVRCAIDNRDRALKPEMYATVAIRIPGERALAVPRAALLRQGDQTLVFREVGVAPDGAVRFERRPVKVDDEGNDGALRVLAGLAPGDRVVSSGGILLLGMV
jgi:cobalt-zinc-cadmium efflux system membrane fusion protein